MSDPKPHETARAYAARKLAAEGIWAKREFSVDENGIEVSNDDPLAVGTDYVYEVNYECLVDRVLEHVTTFYTGPSPARDETPTRTGTPETPSSRPLDWIGDPSISGEEKLALFDALNPRSTTGPQ